VRAALLPWSVLSAQHDRNNAQLAELLDDARTQQRLIDALKPVVKPGERVGLPAILGRHAHPQALAALQAGLNTDVFEIPTLPPNVPGIRLATALRHALEARGVRVEIGMEAVGFHAEAGVIESVESATSARPLKHRASAFLLATGGVLGGGFNSDHTGRFWETVFDLPLTVPQDRRRGSAQISSTRRVSPPSAAAWRSTTRGSRSMRRGRSSTPICGLRAGCWRTWTRSWSAVWRAWRSQARWRRWSKLPRSRWYYPGKAKVGAKPCHAFANFLVSPSISISTTISRPIFMQNMVVVKLCLRSKLCALCAGNCRGASTVLSWNGLTSIALN
jgi:hypothetical protein